MSAYRTPPRPQYESQQTYDIYDKRGRYAGQVSDPHQIEALSASMNVARRVLFSPQGQTIITKLLGVKGKPVYHNRDKPPAINVNSFAFSHEIHHRLMRFKREAQPRIVLDHSIKKDYAFVNEHKPLEIRVRADCMNWGMLFGLPIRQTPPAVTDGKAYLTVRHEGRKIIWGEFGRAIESAVFGGRLEAAKIPIDDERFKYKNQIQYLYIQRYVPERVWYPVDENVIEKIVTGRQNWQQLLPLVNTRGNVERGVNKVPKLRCAGISSLPSSPEAAIVTPPRSVPVSATDSDSESQGSRTCGYKGPAVPGAVVFNGPLEASDGSESEDSDDRQTHSPFTTTPRRFH
ncbi:hypothetical protein IAT40_000354 [Kwoniella sp. CBS 6097]